MLWLSAIKTHDKVGLILFTDRIEKFVPPRKGRSHILRIIRELISFQPTGSGTSIRAALEYFHHVNKKRSIAFILSDFVDDGYEKILRIISRKHDVIAVEISDPREAELPEAGVVVLSDAETGEERWVDTGSVQTRELFKRHWINRTERRRQLFIKSRVDAIPVRIDRPYIKPIVDFFKLRERRL